MIRRYIYNGEMYPKWYGLAWIDFAGDRAVCYPIPVNIVARALRLLWLFGKCPFGYRSVKFEHRAAPQEEGK